MEFETERDFAALAVIVRCSGKFVEHHAFIERHDAASME
jgi:hypothetical protein